MTLVKILLNSVISTKGAKFVMFDVKDFYLNTPMTRYEYMRLKLTDIPEEIIVEYKSGLGQVRTRWTRCGGTKMPWIQVRGGERK